MRCGGCPSKVRPRRRSSASVRPSTGDSNDRLLPVQLVDGGKIIGEKSLDTSRERQKRPRRAAPRGAQDVSG